ncbi:hypothetical protein PSAL_018180 [Pseudooceanicola algae]|uniref:Uncharacterized protein n=2 Tax=Pseudooceanicola algae TaxID=1537215 RepID=A0A418SLF1_9RHOB|nr:hypothetical protein PSAL_018180 [Pseudooceanicola algae]
MRGPFLPYSPFLLVTLIGFAAFAPVFSDEPQVVHPITGETVTISDIDIDALTPEERTFIGDQLADQGIGAGRGGHDGPRD